MKALAERSVKISVRLDKVAMGYLQLLEQNNPYRTRSYCIKLALKKCAVHLELDKERETPLEELARKCRTKGESPRPRRINGTPVKRKKIKK